MSDFNISMFCSRHGVNYMSREGCGFCIIDGVTVTTAAGTFSDNNPTRIIAHPLNQSERIAKLESHLATLREALEEVESRKGQTLLAECCVNKTCTSAWDDGIKIANCLQQYGVNRGYNECAAIATNAIKKCFGEEK